MSSKSTSTSTSTTTSTRAGLLWVVAALAGCAAAHEGAGVGSAAIPGTATATATDPGTAAGPGTATADGVPEFAVTDRDEQEGDHRVLVARRFATTTEAELIDEAERLCPDQIAVRRAIEAYSAEASVPGPEERCVWWATGPDPRVPFAVTAGALEYFVSLAESLRAGRAEGPELLRGSTVERSELAYEASVTHHDVFVHRGERFVDADVARLELRFTLFGESASAFGVSLVRLVVFRPDAPPLPLGDGEAMVWGA